MRTKPMPGTVVEMLYGEHSHRRGIVADVCPFLDGWICEVSLVNGPTVVVSHLALSRKA